MRRYVRSPERDEGLQQRTEKLVDANILTDRALDIKRLKPFTMTAKRMEMARDRSGRNKWALGPLQQLEKMARAMSNLVRDQPRRFWLSAC